MDAHHHGTAPGLAAPELAFVDAALRNGGAQ
jgi:hypothetical protein